MGVGREHDEKKRMLVVVWPRNKGTQAERARAGCSASVEYKNQTIRSFIIILLTKTPDIPAPPPLSDRCRTISAMPSHCQVQHINDRSHRGACASLHILY